MDMEEIIALVEKAKNGDQSAIAQLYEATSKAVYFTALKIVGNPSDAEDVAQDTYVTAISKLSDLKDNATFPKWIKTIAANTAKNYMTKKKPMLFNTDEDEEAALGSIPEVSDEFIPDQAADKKETCRLVSEMIDSLPEKQRAALVMFYYDEMTISEIAEAMGTNNNTIKSRLNYARKYIKDEVEALAKKGTKLYGVAGIPLIAFVLRNLAADTAVPAGIAAKVTAATAATAAATTTAAATATTATATATATATTAAVSTAATGVALGTAAKVAIAAVASVAVIGGGVAISNLFSEEAEPVIAETTISETTPVTTAITTTITTTTAVTTTAPVTTEITTTAVTLPEAEFGVASEIELMLENYLYNNGELDEAYLELIEELYIYGGNVAINRSIEERLGYENANILIEVPYDTYLVSQDEESIVPITFEHNGSSYRLSMIISKLYNVRKFHLFDCSVWDVAGIENLENLKELSICTFNPLDISALSGLTSLESLDIYARYIENSENYYDISAISNLTNLKRLTLCSISGGLSDLTPISNLINLEYLNIYSEDIYDISPIKNLVKLKKLNIRHGWVNDTSALSGLTKLEVLAIRSELNFSSHNCDLDIASFANLKELKSLTLDCDNIINIEALYSLKNLEDLYWICHNIYDVEDREGVENALPDCEIHSNIHSYMEFPRFF